MSLRKGTRLDIYEITAPLGVGGMGEVYRAIDLKLGREVAMKVLPASISQHPESLVRFEREAKALAALNHPNIASIHGFDADGGTHFLVLELVEGDTLSERLRDGPLPLEEALRVARQIAEAVESAHAKGIIHRDLKPGNIKITPDGRVKVLDFGLAKIEQSICSGALNERPIPAEARTQPAGTTLPGAVMGTPAYMSPEQARGQEVDKRTDVWAFGCCLFECLTGQKPFRGQTVSDLMAEVLKSNPDWSQIPEGTPAAVVTLLRRCLEKDTSRRLSSLGDIAITLEEPTRIPASAQRPPQSRFRSVAGALLVVTLAGGLYFWQRQYRTDRAAEAESGLIGTNTPARSAAATGATPISDQKSIAVLAFANLSTDKDNEYFSDGISEELLNVLAKVQGLKVSARTSSFYFKGRQAPIGEIARQLDVAYVVEGSVRKSGNRVRITAQLIKAADGFHVWSDNFDRELKDIFALQDEIAGLIAQNLRLKLGEAPRTAKTVNPEAHRLVLEGWSFWYLRTEEGFTRAEAAFKKALEVDPEFAPAHSGLANNYLIRASYRMLDGVSGADEDMAQARFEAQQAMALDAGAPETQAVLAFALANEGRWAESETYFRLALQRNPSYAIAKLWHSLALSCQGRLDLAIEEVREAEKLDPLAFIIVDRSAEIQRHACRYSEALASSVRAARLRPDPFLPNLGEQTMLLTLLGKQAQAVDSARSIRQNPSPRTRWEADAQAVWTLRKAGLTNEAAAYAQEVAARPWGPGWSRGCVLAALGRFEEALPFLEQTPPISMRMLYWDTMLDAYRDDPRFQELFVKLHCVEEYKVARQTLARMLKP